MGREGPLRIIDNMRSEKLSETIALKMSVEEKETIKGALDTIEKEKNTKMYNSRALNTLFNYWHKYIPNHQQSIRCGGCRNVVLRFWEQVNKEWNK